ncbi:MAG: family N-acetyltransferase [Rickettsiaceae bacterium]|jgi:GNAT superfamily N-acetyltransferase|nr:family N-acetyltransferase [Rickettsiaceae bacterium]
MYAAFPVLAHMYPDMSQEEYRNILPERVNNGYRMLGVFDDEKCVCSAGFWISYRFYCGKFIQLDNMVSLPDYRSKGVGKLVTDFIKNLGITDGCNKVLIDTYVENFNAHRFFLREGFIIRGYHLNYEL